MKLLIGIIIGGLLTFVGVVAKAVLSPPTERGSAILVNIKNDTEHKVNVVTLTSDKGQEFSCTLRKNHVQLVF